MVKKASYIFIIFLILGVLISCNKNKKDAELALISEYLEEHNITEEPQADGLYLIETGFSVSTSSESDFPQKGDTVIVIYKGYLLSNASNKVCMALALGFSNLKRYILILPNLFSSISPAFLSHSRWLNVVAWFREALLVISEMLSSLFLANSFNIFTLPLDEKTSSTSKT